MSDTVELSARTRIDSLLDKGSFVEIGALVTRRSTDFNLSQKEAPADGVITGYGTINQKLVYVYSQDKATLGGSIGEMHAKKIVNLYDLALKTGAPIIGLLDCVGFRLEEATDALQGFGEIYQKQSLASGIIPQISVVLGICGGAVAITTSLSDFTFMTMNQSKLFINSPNALDSNTIEKLNTSSSKFRDECGNVDIIAEDEISLLIKVRELISIIPSNNEEGVLEENSIDDLNRMLPDNLPILDTKILLTKISDSYYLYEIMGNYEKGIITGFIKLNQKTIGIIANREEITDESGTVIDKLEPVLSTGGCYKAEKLIKFCDAFDLPILTLTNVTGYKADIEEEKTIATAVAKLTYALTNATVPKVNLIVGKAYGSAYVTMNSKHIGADFVFALPDTKVGMMDAKTAATIIYEKELSMNEDKITFLNEKTKEYEELQTSPISAAKRGYIDKIIEIPSARKELIYAFDLLNSKRVLAPRKKHGTV